MCLPFKLGLGGRIGDGEQPFSFIHILDLARAYEYIINNTQAKGVFNFSSPCPVTNQHFTQALAKKLNRPALLPIPNFMIKFLGSF